MPRTPAVVLLSVAALTSTACSTSSQARASRPLHAQGDEPVAFSALGAKYRVPARLAITDHNREPGVAWFDFTDQNTGCTGAVVFITSSERARVASYLKESMDEDVAGFKQQGIEAEVVPASEPVLGEKASVRVAKLKSTDDTAAKAHFGVFVAEQRLLVLGNVFCGDPGLMDEQLHFVAQVVNSQQQPN
ncbi:MAG: hypothetical protein INH41_16410 [Myxococcaceae bacterium]|jgi:hypothetical protein|nr:hypothetical protein [Myxococcaceae bacterium]MCA3013965.1 hypothetical protein [Myxococcaceae bacterium]